MLFIWVHFVWSKQVYPAEYFDNLLAEEYAQRYRIPIYVARFLVRMEQVDEEEEGELSDREKEHRRYSRIQYWRFGYIAIPMDFAV